VLDYTKAICKKTVDDLDFALAAFRFATQGVYIAYLIYLLFTRSSIWYLHLTLLIISAAFFVFDIVTSIDIKSIKATKVSFFGNRKKRAKIYEANRRRNLIRRIKFCTSHILKIFVLSASLYPIISSPDTAHPISVMCTTVMALMWLLQVVFEILRLILENRGNLFIEALHADIEFVTKPVSAVKNAFKKITGQEVEEAADPTRARKYLDELVAARNAEKAEVKAAKKEKLSEWLDAKLSKFGRAPIEATGEISDDADAQNEDAESENT
jgi:hypothetical protein